MKIFEILSNTKCKSLFMINRNWSNKNLLQCITGKSFGHFQLLNYSSKNLYWRRNYYLPVYSINQLLNPNLFCIYKLNYFYSQKYGLPAKNVDCKVNAGQVKTNNSSNPDDDTSWNFKFKSSIILAVISFVAIGTYFVYFRRNKEPVQNDDVTKQSKLSNIKRMPATSDLLPDEIPYLLIGGGTASFAAFRAIKVFDPTAKVLIISKELFQPYMRPPLNKELLMSDDQNLSQVFEFKQWNGSQRSIFYEPSEFYVESNKLIEEKNGGVSVVEGWEVTKLNVDDREVTLDDGKIIKYKECLLATGASPKKPTIMDNLSETLAEKVSLFRNISDYKKIENAIQNGISQITVIGGGLLGSEISYALTKRGKSQNLKVTQVFKEEWNLSKLLPVYLSEWTSKQIQNEGVTLFKNAEVKDLKLNKQNGVDVILNNGDILSTDHVIFAIGAEPNTQLAADAGLEIDEEIGGFKVNSEMMARKHLYAAGDCSSFYDKHLGRRRVEHHDHAVITGRIAGENMTGGTSAYNQQSMFWSNIGPKIAFEAIGIIDSSLNTVGVWAASEDAEKDNLKNNAKDTSPDYSKGLVFYLKDDILVGILLWHVYDKIPIARSVLQGRQKYEDLNEVAKHFNIHS